MPSIHDQVSEQFYRWESRARGWRVFDTPVTPEPPFEPFRGYRLAPVIDDGVRPSFLASLFSPRSRSLAPPVIQESHVEPEPEPTELIREYPLIELQATLPASLNIPRDSFEEFLSNVRACSRPLAFELVGSEERIISQFVSDPHDGPLLRRQLIAHFPEATFLPAERSLAAFEANDEYTAIVEFGLNREILYQISTGKTDPFISIVGALSELKTGESGIYQVIFEPCRNPWSEAILQYVSDTRGHTSFFANRPEFASLAEKKLSRALYGVVLRIAAKSDTFENSWEILRNLAGALSIFAHPAGNEFVPLRNDEYLFKDHLEDLVKRQSRRSGMLLNSDELIGLVHLPSAAVRTSKLRRQTLNSKAAPHSVLQREGLLLGPNYHAGISQEVRLSPEQRTRHIHVIGASGTGKSNLLLNSIRQDIANGQGLAVLDPHGDLIDRILESIPDERISDVILIDPSDESASVGFNILSAHSDIEKTLLASDLISVFRRLSQSWGDQMESVLRNAILAFLESTKGGTLADLRTFLLDAKFRTRFLETVADPDIRFYWEKGFSSLTGNKSIGPVLTRLEAFLAPKPLRFMVAQRANKLNFEDMLDTGKILLARLSQGAIGKENAYLLGSLLTAKFQQTAMSRQRLAVSGRRDFWIYIDEFQNFITPSLSEILAGARKYRIGLTLAHQELRQLDRDPEVASATLSNCLTRIVFKVGDADARTLERGFSSFSSTDLQKLPIGHAIVRVEGSDQDFNLEVPLSLASLPDPASRRSEVVRRSREQYATPRAHIEKELLQHISVEALKEEPKVPPRSSPSSPPLARPDQVSEKSETLSTTPEATPLEPNAPAAFSKIVGEPDAQAGAERVQTLTSHGVNRTEDRPVRDMGIGGAQHQALQQRIKAAAEALGFGATIEKQILNREGSIDLFIQGNGASIACEISITTTVDHEVGNVRKCFKAGISNVAVICTSEDRLRKIKHAVDSCTPPSESSAVAYFLPDAFLAHICSVAKAYTPESTGEPPPKLGKYKVRTSAATLSAEDAKTRESLAIKMLAESMRGGRKR